MSGVRGITIDLIENSEGDAPDGERGSALGGGQGGGASTSNISNGQQRRNKFLLIKVNR